MPLPIYIESVCYPYPYPTPHDLLRVTGSCIYTISLKRFAFLMGTPFFLWVFVLFCDILWKYPP